MLEPSRSDSAARSVPSTSASSSGRGGTVSTLSIAASLANRVVVDILWPDQYLCCLWTQGAIDDGPASP
jgi:hypothetical protein